MAATAKIRGEAKALVTRMMTATNLLLADIANEALVRLKYGDYHRRKELFSNQHQKYHASLEDKSDMEASEAYKTKADVEHAAFEETVEAYLIQCRQTAEDAGVDTKENQQDDQDPLGPIKARLNSLELQRLRQKEQHILEMEIVEKEAQIAAERQEQVQKIRHMKQTFTEHQETRPVDTTMHEWNPLATPFRQGMAEDAGSTPLAASSGHVGPSGRFASTPMSHFTSMDLTDVMSSVLNASHVQTKALAESMLVPKATLPTFNGDPLSYFPFIRRFENLVEAMTTNASTRLATLQSQCTGWAGKLINCCEFVPTEEGYRKARQLLKTHFGDESIISQAWIDKIHNYPQVTKSSDLRDYALELRSCKETLEAMGYLAELANRRSMAAMIEKLPWNLKQKWLSKNYDIKTKDKRQPIMEDVVKFVEKEADVLGDPAFGYLVESSGPTMPASSERTVRRVKATAAAAESTMQPTDRPKKCFMCEGPHYLFWCAKFKGMKLAERLSWTISERRCQNCLHIGHPTKDCTRPPSCRVSGCDANHNTFLHPDEQLTASETQVATEPATNTACHFARTGSRNALPILPVRVRSMQHKSHVDTYALLDTGATHSFCTEALARALGAEETKSTIQLSTLDTTRDTVETTTVDIEVGNIQGACELEMRHVFTRPRLSVSLANVVTDDELSRWPHLADLELPRVEAGEVQLVIGQDTPDALKPLDARIGGPGAPYATKTALGWTINGPVAGAVDNRVSTYHCQVGDKLEEAVTKLWQLEEVDTGGPEKVSMNDRKVLHLWDESLHLTDGRYTLDIPFKMQPPSLPNNRGMALKQLHLTAARLKRDKALLTKYSASMAELISKGWAEKDVRDRRDGVSYIPHHAVFHPRKPEKLRVVWDCAAKYFGTSLNDLVHQGPDLANKLVGVLLRFRQERIAVMADIEAMFNQVVVSTKDRDVFGFNCQPAEKPATHGGILSIISSVYDPLGFASPYILHAKFILQELCRRQLPWDAPIPDELALRWEGWLGSLPGLRGFAVERCLGPDTAGIVSAEIHHFADASQSAYGAVAYLRILDVAGKVHCTFLVSKARLGPLRPTTIPRLELLAAVESVKLDRMLRRELELELLESVFWTDSMIVLWYIAQDDKRYQTYVANRVAYIREHTKVSQWRHVGTADNPADDASRGMTAEELLESSRWLTGPTFLKLDPENWPALPSLGCSQPPAAELKKLAPFRSPDGLLHVGGRLDKSCLGEGAKHQWVLPKHHHLTTLVIRDHHERSGHAGTERVLAETRRWAWILQGRSAVRRVVSRCMPCLRSKATAMTQVMADLPTDRVTPGAPAFSCVGVDYFGPFLVKRNRTELKRYGCVFTCLASRAVHLEVSESLTTDSFLNALECFMDLRGRPTRIRSDNGTNFVGAHRELAQCLKEWNRAQIHNHLLQEGIDWIFNPPGASHMGGVWERQIRTIRSILIVMLKQQTINDECLRTLFYKVANIINGRPVSKRSEDPGDEEALTPNHLLLLRSNCILPAGSFVEQDCFRKRWRQMQYLASLFWRRWVTEYLPLLQERTKWSKPQANLKVGDLVLVRHEAMTRGDWPLGLVIEVYPGKDGYVRSAQIRFRGGLYDRPISKLCLLEGTPE